MIYVLPVYVLVPLIMYIVCVFVMICLLCSPFTSVLDIWFRSAQGTLQLSLCLFFLDVVDLSMESY